MKIVPDWSNLTWGQRLAVVTTLLAAILIPINGALVVYLLLTGK